MINKCDYGLYELTRSNTIKNVSSSTSKKNTPPLGEFKKILPSTLIYELILLKINMNANIMNTHYFYFIKFDLKGHRRALFV